MDHLRYGKKFINKCNKRRRILHVHTNVGRQFILTNCTLYLTMCTIHSVGTSSNTCSFCILATDK